ncbi:hypothetical protein QVD17_22055 [Tagetes erecta]|uniref:Uncharacterized protein n=1 Tax=Tagetes erecta TaxID=13708 RepID=A0AAD8KHG4_TARER|nr:hypothetical protein QVD17_22055 [Tagetes erecta]
MNGLQPLCLPLYSPYHYPSPSPPFSLTLISPIYPNFTSPFYINSQSICSILLLLYLFLPSSLSFSLVSLSYATSFVVSQRFRRFRCYGVRRGFNFCALN